MRNFAVSSGEICSATEDEMSRYLPVIREERTRQDDNNLGFFRIIWGDWAGKNEVDRLSAD